MEKESHIFSINAGEKGVQKVYFVVLYSQVLSSEFIDKLLEILREENALLKTHISEYETVISKKEEKILILEDQQGYRIREYPFRLIFGKMLINCMFKHI